MRRQGVLLRWRALVSGNGQASGHRGWQPARVAQARPGRGGEIKTESADVVLREGRLVTQRHDQVHAGTTGERLVEAEQSRALLALLEVALDGPAGAFFPLE